MSNVRQYLLNYITDVERCATAGAITVAGTGRLAQYANQLNHLSQHVPALQEIATLNQTLTQCHEREAAPHLLHLVTQTRQLRIALAATADELHALGQVPDSGPWHTDLPLADLLSELQTIRRSVSVREALKDGSRTAKTDLRLVNEWLRDSLLSSAPFPVDLASDVLLPAYGADIAVEFQREEFNATEITQMRRLVALCRLVPELGRAMILRDHPELRAYVGDVEPPTNENSDAY